MSTYELCHLPETICLDRFNEAIVFAIKFLDLDLDISIEFEDLPEYHFGSADYDELDGEIEASVAISSNISEVDAITTMFHELVHIRQFHTGMLESGPQLRWLGETYDCDYKDLPWEKEAYAKEKELATVCA